MHEERGVKEVKKTGHQPRASITFPPQLYRNLEHLAKLKKVSLAWIVRDAAEMYIAGHSGTGSVSGGGANE